MQLRYNNGIKRNFLTNFAAVMMLRLYIYIYCAFCLPLPLLAQSDLPPETPIELRVGKAAYKGDSIPHVIFPTLPKYPPKTGMTDRQRTR